MEMPRGEEGSVDPHNFPDAVANNVRCHKRTRVEIYLTTIIDHDSQDDRRQPPRAVDTTIDRNPKMFREVLALREFLWFSSTALRSGTLQCWPTDHMQ